MWTQDPTDTNPRFRELSPFTHDFQLSEQISKTRCLNGYAAHLCKHLDGALNFTSVLRFCEADDQPAAELRIPVVNDVVVPQKTVIPNGYSLIELRP